MQKPDLQRVLSRVKKPFHLLRFPDGTQLRVLVHGGRALGLFAPGDDENFLWTHAALASSRAARAFFASASWHNPGGDRTWLSPEIDVFFPEFPKLDRYVQPPELDPGEYRVDQKNGCFALKTRLKLTLSRTRATCELTLSKQFAPAPNPLRHKHPEALGELRYAGYTQTVSLRSVKNGAACPAQVSLCNLLQLPHGGDMLIATYGRASVESIMGKVRRTDLGVRDGLIRWRRAAKGEHKISVRAACCTGRMGYVHRRSRRQWDLVVRNFQVNPFGDYPEAPWHKPDEVGHCAQACSVSSALGDFSELEYHSPAITIGTMPTPQPGSVSCKDTSQTWAYRGSPQAIRCAVMSLLGCNI